MKEKEKSYEALPLVLDVSDIQHIMGISRVSAYTLVQTPGFPAAKSGRLYKISKRAFFDWLERGGAGRADRPRQAQN